MILVLPEVVIKVLLKCTGGGQWTSLKPRNPPPALQEHTLVHHNGFLYMFGGEVTLNNQTPLWIYSIQVGFRVFQIKVCF